MPEALGCRVDDGKKDRTPRRFRRRGSKRHRGEDKETAELFFLAAEEKKKSHPVKKKANRPRERGPEGKSRPKGPQI